MNFGFCSSKVNNFSRFKSSQEVIQSIRKPQKLLIKNSFINIYHFIFVIIKLIILSDKLSVSSKKLESNILMIFI